VQQICGRKTASLFTKKGLLSSIFDDIFEEALGFRVSSEHGGGHDTTKEEQHSSQWNEGHKKLIHEVHRTSRAYRGAARPTLSINTIICSTSVHSAVLRIWIHHHVGGGGEETGSP
jgi:hypothetical protein